MLTYDDGPGKDLTPILLKIFEEHNVRANFFMIGRKIESELDLTHHIANKGHTIGSHSFRHLHAWKKNPFEVRRDIQAGFQICNSIPTSNIFRPPFGKITLATLFQTWGSNQKLAWWTIDSTDTWVNPLPIERTVERIRNEGGGVILMHDYDRKDKSNNEYVLSLTLKLIQLARDEGYCILTLQDILKKRLL